MGIRPLLASVTAGLIAARRCVIVSIERVVVAGVKTNVCIRATVQDAFANGFSVIVPKEATNSNRAHLAAASLEDIERYFGEVVSLDAALEMLV